MSLELISIDSADDPRIIQYHSMRDNLIDKDGSNLFVAEGDKVVDKLLKSDLKIHSILARRSFYEEFSLLITNRKDVLPYFAEEEILQSIIGFRMHTGVMAIATKPENCNIDNLSNHIICLNSIVDSENVGSIIRNSTAFGFDSVIHDKSTSSPFLRRAVRVSMGSVLNHKIFKSDNLENDLTYLKSQGYTIISAEISGNSESLYEFKFPDKFVLIFGNEAQGIDSNILSISDMILHIPISQQIESLNVASTSAIFMAYLRNGIPNQYF
jgi:tRNA G18 (ribose-2'-O)-methylase SpoU